MLITRGTRYHPLFHKVAHAIKSMDLPFDVVIDSYFDIHNLAGIDFMEMTRYNAYLYEYVWEQEV